MIYTLRAAFAVAALAALPQLASAGPIQWGYRAEGPDGTVLRELAGLTDLAWSDFFLPNPQTNGVKIPDPYPGNALRSDVWRSTAVVTFTDEVSGQSATFDIWRDFIQQYEVQPDGGLNPVYEGESGGPWPDAVTKRIGANNYSVRAPGGELMVNVAPAVTTPEPGTLALAGLGLGAMGLVRRLRR